MHLRPVIFLDFDDVIALDPECSGKAVANGFSNNWIGVQPDFWVRIFSNDARQNLANLHEIFSPQFVISSSWCNYLSLEQMMIIFSRTELDFIGQNLHEKWRTPRLESFGRLAEIQTWIRKYHQQRQAILILDDYESGWNLINSDLDKKNLVIFCEPRLGFDISKLTIAIDSLQRQISSGFVGVD